MRTLARTSMTRPDFAAIAAPAAQRTSATLLRVRTDDPHTTRVALVEAWEWHRAVPAERWHWYEMRLTWLGDEVAQPWLSDDAPTRWRTAADLGDAHANRLHFSVVECLDVHPGGVGGAARLGPIGQIRMLPTSLGVGTWLRAKLVAWVASLHPTVPVLSGELSSVDGAPDNRERRDRFYDRSGFTLSTPTPSGDGAFWAERLDRLNPTCDDPRLSEFDVAQLRELFEASHELEARSADIAGYQVRAAQLMARLTRAQRRSGWAVAVVVGAVLALRWAFAHGHLVWH